MHRVHTNRADSRVVIDVLACCGYKMDTEVTPCNSVRIKTQVELVDGYAAELRFCKVREQKIHKAGHEGSLQWLRVTMKT